MPVSLLGNVLGLSSGHVIGPKRVLTPDQGEQGAGVTIRVDRCIPGQVLNSGQPVFRRHLTHEGVDGTSAFRVLLKLFLVLRHLVEILLLDIPRCQHWEIGLDSIEVRHCSDDHVSRDYGHSESSPGCLKVTVERGGPSHLVGSVGLQHHESRMWDLLGLGCFSLRGESLVSLSLTG
jgi:hypothetical protein